MGEEVTSDEKWAGLLVAAELLGWWLAVVAEELVVRTGCGGGEVAVNDASRPRFFFPLRASDTFLPRAFFFPFARQVSLSRGPVPRQSRASRKDLFRARARGHP